MKIKVTILILAVYFLDSYSQDISNKHLSNQNLKGKVKSLIETSYFINEADGQIQKDKLTNIDTYLFNEHGNQLENSHSNSGNMMWNHIFRYDDKENMLEENRYENDGEVSWKKTYKYDSSGKKVEEKNFNPKGKLDVMYTSKYDENGNILSQDMSGKAGRGQNIFRYKYDDKGNRTEEYLNDLSGTVKIINRYDSKGGKSELSIYSSNGTLEEKQTFNYDENGNMTENLIFGLPDFKPGKIIYKYNNRGDLTEKSRYDTDGELLEKETNVFEYDDHENLISEKHYKFYQGTRESNQAYIYSDFDAYGNWITRLNYLDDKPYSVTEREIEYYVQ